MVVEMLANIHCLQARNLVDEHEKDTLPQALKDRSANGGWPKQAAEILSSVATACTRGTKTRTIPAQVLSQVESVYHAIPSNGEVSEM
jgi:hypothetical protein